MPDDIELQVTQIKGQLNDLSSFVKKAMVSLYERNLELNKRIKELETELNKYKHE